MKTKEKSITKNNSKKLWVKSLTTLGAIGIVGTCTLPSISSCAGKDTPEPAISKATFSDIQTNIAAFAEINIATITFTDVANIDDVSYEFTLLENDFIHLEHKFKDDKHYITAQSKPWLSGTPKIIDVTVKVLMKEIVIGEMSQAIKITGQPVTNILQPKNFAHTAGESIETICSFDIPSTYKDIFESYKAVALDATSELLNSNYKIEQKTTVGNTLSFKLTSNANLGDEVKQLKISVVGVCDWQGVKNDVFVFESSSFAATITHVLKPAVQIVFGGSTFNSNENISLARMNLTDIVSPEKNLSFVLKGDDLGFFKLSYSFLSGEHTIQAKTATVANGDKTIPNAQIVVSYNGKEMASTPAKTITLKALNIVFGKIESFTGESESVKKSYINMRLGSEVGTVAATTNIEIKTYLSQGDVELTTYLFKNDVDVWPLKAYSLTLPKVTTDKTETIYFVVFGRYVDFDGKTQTIELYKTPAVTITTTAPITK